MQQHGLSDASVTLLHHGPVSSCCCSIGLCSHPSSHVPLHYDSCSVAYLMSVGLRCILALWMPEVRRRVSISMSKSDQQTYSLANDFIHTMPGVILMQFCQHWLMFHNYSNAMKHTSLFNSKFILDTIEWHKICRNATLGRVENLLYWHR